MKPDEQMPHTAPFDPSEEVTPDTDEYPALDEGAAAGVIDARHNHPTPEVFDTDFAVDDESGFEVTRLPDLSG